VDGYGYLWKIPAPNTGFDGAFYHTGLGVHLLLVWPDEDIVLVHRVDTDEKFDMTDLELRQLVDLAFSARTG
jgi:CubicO group peptidase (beta-lactamase class C family)